MRRGGGAARRPASRNSRTDEARNPAMTAPAAATDRPTAGAPASWWTGRAWHALAVALWLLVLLGAIAVAVKTARPTFEDARRLTDFSPGDAQGIERSLGSLHLTVTAFAAIGLGVQVVLNLA